MKKSAIVIESPGKLLCLFVRLYLLFGVKVYVIEPFHAYHHCGKNRFYPRALPEYILRLIKENKIEVIKADDIDARHIYQQAAERAVNAVETVYGKLQQRHKAIISYAISEVGSTKIEKVFKKDLCDKLGIFYSAHILFKNTEALLGGRKALFYTSINSHYYKYIRELLEESNDYILKDGKTYFALSKSLADGVDSLKSTVKGRIALYARILIKIYRAFFSTTRIRECRKEYKYAVSIVSPIRQLAGNSRGPEFIIDGNSIKKEEVVFVPLVHLTKEQEDKLAGLNCAVLYIGRVMSFDPVYIVKLLKLARVCTLSTFSDPLNIKFCLYVSIYEFLKWNNVLYSVAFKNFITHADFGLSHIPRNIAFHAHEVTTWYYTDSINCSHNFAEYGRVTDIKHPFWTYMNYDFFITWEQALADYFSSHPGSFKESRVVGCLWSSLIRDTTRNDKFVVAVFDSTYTVNGITSYKEGIAFAEHILKLAEDFSDIDFLLKVKKAKNFHGQYDPVNGPELERLYKILEEKRNIRFCNEYDDTASIISAANMVISFPFTSTTFEAICAGKHAIWHDPEGYYRNTVYAKGFGVVTHDYNELKAAVEIAINIPNDFKTPFPDGFDFFDPHRDTKALDRFRNLLTSNYQSKIGY